MQRFSFFLIFCVFSSLSIAQSNINIGVAGIHRPVYETYDDGYSFNFSPVLEYQFRWTGKRSFANRIGAELIYAQGTAEGKEYSSDSTSYHGTFADVKKTFLQVSYTKELEFDKIDLYLGGMLQLPLWEYSNTRSYTWFNYGQIVGDYDWDYERLWFRADSTPLGWIHLKMGARYHFNERHSIALDYMIGLNKRHIIGLKYGFQFKGNKQKEN